MIKEGSKDKDYAGYSKWYSSLNQNQFIWHFISREEMLLSICNVDKATKMKVNKWIFFIIIKLRFIMRNKAKDVYAIEIKIKFYLS